MKNYALLLATYVLVGCGSFVEHIRVDQNEMGSVRKNVPILSQEELQGKEYSLMQSLTSTSCKNKLWDEAPSKDDAIDQLRIKASRADANALINVSCETPSGTDLTTNCWSSIVCHGAAIKVRATSEKAAEPEKSKDVYTELTKLDDLLKRGIITRAEFDAQKKKILNGN